MKEIFGVILVLLLVGCTTYVTCTVWGFVVGTPKQLKRIADALEWRNKHGN